MKRRAPKCHNGAIDISQNSNKKAMEEIEKAMKEIKKTRKAQWEHVNK